MYKAWQDMVADPNLDRRFGTEFIMEPLGCIITGTFYGTEDEYQASGVPNLLPSGGSVTTVSNDWLTSLLHDAENEVLYLSNTPTPFYSKSLGFRPDELLSGDSIDSIFQWVDTVDKGTLLWFIIFDATGGAVADVPMNGTAYAHRDKVLFYQSYAIGLPLLDTTKDFLTSFHNKVLGAIPNTTYGTYPGYVDPAIPNGQEEYWMTNLPQLQQLKLKWDSADLFHNPQSVRPIVAQ